MIYRELPERISRLNEIAGNLWWSWHDEARSLFRILDYPLWMLSVHNPVKVLKETSEERIQDALQNRHFLAIYDSVLTNLDKETGKSGLTQPVFFPDDAPGPLAYFSMEYAFHSSLPIYAGGLGVLAGDICKELSDMAIPTVTVGFMYPQGYFHQHIEADGHQREIYQNFDERYIPASPVLSAEGSRAITHVWLGDSYVAVGAWHLCVGGTNVYLLDTDFKENPEHHRRLVSRLYIAEPETRLKQEIILGIGGVRVLHALDIHPAVWHANEGHTAFMTLERIHEEIESGSSFRDAIEKVRETTVFSTHTPVKAGHDIFTDYLIQKYFGDKLVPGIERKMITRTGNYGGADLFNMTALAMRTSGYPMGVSKLHGNVTRKMWHGLWPDIPEAQVPISYVTNGIHVPTWIAPELMDLYSEYLGEDWIDRQDDPETWEEIPNIPDEKIWDIRLKLKRKLGTSIRERMRQRWAEDKISQEQLIALGALIDPEGLTIGFVRRIAEYKRPALIFRDLERLKKIVTNESNPVHVIFSGKAHPQDMNSKRILQQIYSIAVDPNFRGRIIYVEDYDLHIARYLLQGIDVWLNTPRRLREASGTSGMKATLNGALHFSVLDGWWYEAYTYGNGWAIGPVEPIQNHEEEDNIDAESIYQRLETEIVPLFYKRDIYGVPHGWIRMMKESIRTNVPRFCARRMMKDYIRQAYLPILDSLKKQ